MSAFNARYKIYPDGTLAQIMISSGDCFKDAACGAAERPPRIPSLMRKLAEVEDASASTGDAWEREKEENARRGRSRARNRIFDLCQCNAFDLFVTLTVAPEKCNRYDYAAILRTLNRWLDNRVRRKGLRYVVVPELHKDGAVHFHGLLNDVLPLVDSGHKDRQGHVVYNLPDWPLGFTTAIRLYGERGAVSRYVTKYISKTEEKIGGRWYLHGGELQEPTFTYGTVDYDSFTAPGMFEYIPEKGYAFKIVNLV